MVEVEGGGQEEDLSGTPAVAEAIIIINALIETMILYGCWIYC